MIDTSIQRVEINQVIENQLPEFVQSESPLFVDFMKQYYISQEYQGGSINIAENLDRYTKLQTYVGAALTEYTGLSTNTESFSDTIFVDSTKGYPNKYGLLKIDDEIITYTGIGTTSFTGCVRGFSGVDNMDQPTRPDLLSFNTTVGAAHTGGTKVYNLSNLFIRDFYKKLKTTFASGFEQRKLDSDLDQVKFIRQIKDFYKTKGTNESYKILFRALYGEEVKIIKPSEFLIKPSDADYGFAQDFVVKSITGDPRNLNGSTLFQDLDKNDKNILGASGAISDVKDFIYDGEHYYQISISKDTIEGHFKVPGRTRITDPVSVGGTVITVDTTVGFPTSGSLSLPTARTAGVVTYTDKTTNQFIGLSTMVDTLSIGDDVRYNNVAYGYSFASAENKIEVVITGVLKDFEIPKETFYFNKGDRIRVGTFGINKGSEDFNFGSWIYNTTIKQSPKTVTKISSSSFNIVTESDHQLLEEDSIEVLDANSNLIGLGRVLSVISGSTLILGDLPGINESTVSFIRRRLKRGNSTVHDNITKYTTDVQNTYDYQSEDVYVTSPSIPSLGNEPIVAPDRSVTWTGGSGGDLIQVTDGATDHGFYSGEVITYDVISGFLGQLIDGNNYFVDRVDSNNIRLANSLPDLVNQTFVDATGTGSFKISVPDLANKKLEHQKLLKKIPLSPLFDGNQYQTIPGTTGILINGTEISNYKSGDVIFFGGVESIDVLEGGSGYDIINPPKVSVESLTGIGISATPVIKGKIERIDILDPGFDYVDPPVVEISGGNGKNAVLRSRLRQVDHFVDFDASSTGNAINIANDTIGFSTFHKFRDGESVIYKTFNTGAIGIASAGITTTAIQTTPDQRLVNDAVYFVSRIDASTIKLANTKNEALSQSNLLNLTGFADGTQRFQSVNKKLILGDIIVDNPGEGYENKRRLVPLSGINTFSDYIEYDNHGFEDGELIRYSSDGIRIGGLDTDQDYYVLKINDNQFRLASAGIGTTLSNANYVTKQSVGLTSIGSGDHVFNYPPITVEVRGTIGIDTSHPENYHARINPIVRGSITSVNIEKAGIGYGASTTFNFSIPPTVRVSSGSSSEYKAIVSNGKIQSIIVTRSGGEYTSTPDLTILGDGVGAKVVSSISNGIVDNVTVKNGGVGYTTSLVGVQENLPGSGVVFLPKIRSWQINNVKRYEDIFFGDDGFLSRGDNDIGTKFSSYYVPRGLRKILKQKNSDGTIDYASNDLNLVNNAEQVSLNHSPIIGWAYDGNPIYGPYGYDRKDGGVVRIMRSSYSLKTSRENGPPISNFPLGFFIEDYEYLGNGDLDENNGRYCVTPDYPKGTFAYFATINPTQNETSGTFKNFRSPEFPYLIGENFAAKPNDWNFTETNNQNIDLNTLSLERNTYPYKLDSSGSEYEGIFDSRKKVLQEAEVNYASPGSINKYEIESAGSGYKVNEKLQIKNLGNGNGFSAKVSSVGGKEIVSIASTVVKIDNVVFSYNNQTGNVIGLSSQPHGLVIGDVINVSGLSTDTLRSLDGQHRIGFSTSKFLLDVGIGTTGTTGIVTSIDVAGDFNSRSINSNDILSLSGIGSTNGLPLTETVLVLNVDNINGKLRVQREFNGVVGVAHSVGQIVTSLNRAITFNVGISNDIITNVNIPYYFNPIESVSLGSTAGVGVGSTVAYTYKVSGNGISSTFVPTQQIFLQDHGFITGQKLLYSNGGGNSLSVYNGISTFNLPNNSFVFAINEGQNFLGLSTNPIAGIGTTGNLIGIGLTAASTGIGSTAHRLFYSGHGTGTKHSLKPQKEEITGFIEKIVGTVVCKENHDLLQNDTVSISLTPGITTSYQVQYDDLTKRTIINPKAFGASSVNTNNSVITISNHGYKTGDKVLYKSSDPATPLINNEVYFIVRIDDNSFKLSETNFKSKTLIPNTITITDDGDDHTISLINPPINLTRGYKVGFAVSDTSLTQVVSGKRTQVFDFNFFRDPNFTNPYFNNKNDDGFQVVGVGTVGVTTTATVDLSLTENSPKELFYKLTPINLNIDADSKRNPVVDKDIINYSSLKISDSTYNGTYVISGIGSTTFTFNIPRQPEKDGYTREESVILKYATPSTTASGSIDNIQLVSKGRNYTTIPVVTSIASTEGVGAIIRLNSTDVGTLKRYTNKNIGFDYSADKTIQPSVQLPQILRLDRLSTISNIGISSGGKNYLEPPKVIVIDRVTGQVNNEIITRSELQGTSVSEVELLRNTNSLYDTDPKIVATNNTNGIKVKNLSYTSGTNVVALTLEGTFTESTYPFTLGKKIYVENIGIGSTGSGYNSSNYSYEPFVITGVNTNPGGGNATVSYKLDTLITNPGIFSGPSSSGRVIPFEDVATFNIGIKPNQFSVGEIVSTGDKIGTVVAWNEDNKYLKILSNDIFSIGDSINGRSSKSIAFITQTNTFTSSYEIDSNSEVRSGFRRETGKLNTELQKIQDSDYYQNFSYSLNSSIQYETWKDPVNSLTHVVGFKNFADVNIVSIASTDDKNRNKATVGVSSNVAVVVSDLVSEDESLHKTYDFDLVTENSKNIDGLFASDEINFNNKIITDYIESRTNRVIPIDSISSEFNDLPRATAFSDVADFNITEVDGVKFYVLVFDTRFSGEKQIMQVNLLHDQSTGYMMSFGRVETQIDLGTFDFTISGNIGSLRFFPAKSKNNNYAVRILSQETFKDTKTTGISSLTVGTGYEIKSVSSGIGSTDPSPVQVVGFGTTAFTTTKLFVLTNELGGEQRSQLNELVVLNDSEEVYLLDYAQMTNDNTSSTDSPSVGLGTFGADVRSGITSVYFTPVTGVGVTMRVHQTSIGSTATGIGSTTISLNQILTTTTNIAATGTPQPTRISGFSSNTYVASDALIEIHDTTNDRYAVTQVTMIHDTVTPYFTEFGYMDNFSLNPTSFSGIGTIGVGYSSASGGDLELRLSPPANTAVTTKVFQYNLRETGTGGVGFVTFTDSRLKSQEGTYTGTDNDIKFSFDLKHTGDPIFHKVFDSEDDSVVDLVNNQFIVNNHFFQTGEELTYNPIGSGTTMNIGIAATTITGIGVTNKLPSTVFAVKIAENKFKLAGSASEALQPVPDILDITSVGIGTTQSFSAKNLNSKALITLDNNIQSPVIQSPVNTTLAADAGTISDFITLSGISSFFSGDVIKINNEFMKIDTIGIGASNRLLVKRAQLNSALANHSEDDTVTKFLGNYQIVKDAISFTDAPKGSKGPAGLTTTSTFVGRVFTHTGIPGGTQDTYSNNFVFDTVEDQFTGISTNFILKSGGANVTGFATNTGVILLNEIFQNPNDDYNIVETAGITSVSFTGAGVSVSYDVNVSSIPRGGIIVSVAETSSFGYQPLVAAGGTAIVSAAGTVESVSIGNSGSGYRVGLQTNILVKAVGSSGIVTIGKANVSAGLVTSVTITNGGGSGFSSATPPDLEFDLPLNYENMRLVGSSTGIGASVSVRVGSASSVISFQITNYGYNYKIGDVLTIEEGGQAGILTDANLVVKDFALTVEDTFNDSFSGFTFGELEKLNTFENLFDGDRKTFNITKTIGASETPITLRSAKGSPIRPEYNCLVFLNDIIQIPFESYVFNGGSQITFSEAPKLGDRLRIYYYRGSEHDVVDVDILETVKPGDKLTINQYPDNGLNFVYQQLPRTISGITTSDAVTTNTYIDAGITTNRTLERPVTWKKQISDVVIGNIDVGKDRVELEAGIRPTAYIIKNVSAASTEIFVDTAVPLFNQTDDIVEVRQSVLIFDRTTKTGVAATALVSGTGGISTAIISSGGSGYTSTPLVSIGVTAGIGTIHAGIGTTSTNATAIATISGVGTVSAITIVNAGAGYTNTNPPVVMIEAQAQTQETVSSIKYQGDFGHIVGIATTAVAGIGTALQLDFYVPDNSVLRDTSVMGSAVDVSGIQSGYYFTAFETNVGGGVTSYQGAIGNDNEISGVGTIHLDNIYKVHSAKNITGPALLSTGVGNTTLRRVTVSIDSIEGITRPVGIGTTINGLYYGKYSWGRLHDFVKPETNSFTVVNTDGVTGIKTGPVIIRLRDLKESYI